MTCPQCDEARARPGGGVRIDATCQGCIARELARSPQYFASRQAGRITPEYRKLLKHFFRDEWQRGHQLAKEWAP